MSNNEMERILEEMQVQRKERAIRRRDFQRRLESLREGFKHRGQQNHQPEREQRAEVMAPPSAVPEPMIRQIERDQNSQGAGIQYRQPSQHDNSLNQEQQNVLLQNKALKEELVKLEQRERSKLDSFRANIKQIHQKYSSQVDRLTTAANSNRQTLQQKLSKLKEQLPAAQSKNAELQKVNAKLKEQIIEGNVLMGKCATEIKQEYSLKIQKIEKVYQDSNEKIEAFQKKFDEQEFVENTLKNEQILKGIEQSAKKAEEASKILSDYGQLLEGKKQILQQIHENNRMKEQEIEKIKSIEERMNSIMENLTREKRIIVEENRKMVEQLGEIKQMLLEATQGNGS